VAVHQEASFVNTQIRQIIPYLWYNRDAEEAARFYVSLFPNSRITNVMHTPAETPSGNEVGGVLAVNFELDGQLFSALNGGPTFALNPSISLVTYGDTVEEVDQLFARLAEGGSVLLPLQEYPFSERFGWVVDRYGLSWQIDLGNRPQKVTPALLFTQAQDGRAEAAMNLYTGLFANSGIERIEYYGAEDEGRVPGTVKVATFRLNGQQFVAMDGGPGHTFTFNEAVSLMVTCETQQDVDRLWDALSAHPEAEQCGWLKDQFGVSWQIVPVAMMEMLSSGDPERTRRVMEAFMPMKKLDLETLQIAYDGD
jgi:predicted 3-demethylubiquinone-9 3-methyltransferase (glyoxalase superfamily)